LRPVGRGPNYVRALPSDLEAQVENTEGESSTDRRTGRELLWSGTAANALR
jgi:hypothetical protein